MNNNRGQIVVEYVLLLVIAVGIAALLTSRLVSRNADDPGILVAKWHSILQVVGDDVPDKRKK
ncbi:hypothetical protein [Bdellovibrio bacteriovorus]|uniref:hypothetical protein n=1 Tax=Bdellovibrio bacteriovorus TaxID=959 RepID=UPI0035A8B374